jgi:hypothetical protein
MRTTQFIGLSEAARQLVAGDSVVDYVDHIERRHADGTVTHHVETVYRSTVAQEESGGFAFGMFEEEIPLSRFTLPDGRTLVEDVQAQPWSSGPCIFTALRDETTGDWVPESLWPQEEIDAC